jgi:hypothetical protein
MLIVGILVIVAGLGLFAVTLGKTKDWSPPLAKLIWVMGWPQQPSARDRVRMVSYIAVAFGTLEVIRAIWFPR